MTDKTDDKQKQRRPGQFVPGQSGNPDGRKAGSRNRATVLLDKIGDEAAEEVLRGVIAKAAEGDLKAAEMILARAWPQRKGRPVALELPPIESAMDVLKALSAVVAAMGDGAITPEEAALVGGLLEAKRKALETVAIEQRLTALEDKSK